MVMYTQLQRHAHGCKDIAFEGVHVVDTTGKSFAMVHLLQRLIAYDFVLTLSSFLSLFACVVFEPIQKSIEYLD